MTALHTFVCLCWIFLIMGENFRVVELLLEDQFCRGILPISKTATECCQSTAIVNETSIRVNYIVTSANSSEGTVWGLSVNISWEEVNTDASSKFEVEWEEAISEEDLNGSEPLSPRTGECLNTLGWPCTDYFRSVSIIDEPNFFSSDVLFGFRYRFRVRVIEGQTPVGLSTCFSGHSDPSRFTSPDCYGSTGDLEFCKSQPIVFSSPPSNAKVVETLLQPGKNETLLYLRISWMKPIQVNGRVTDYTLRWTPSSGNMVHSNGIKIIANESDDTVFQILAPDFFNNTLYRFEIVPTITTARGVFDSITAGQSVFFSHRTFFPKPTETTTQTATTLTRSTGMAHRPSSGLNLILLVVLGISIVIIVICVAFIIMKIVKKRRTKNKIEGQSVYFRPQSGHRSSEKETQSRRDAVAPEFKTVEIFDYNNIKEGDLLGSGQYGEVFKGEALLQGKTTWTVVAIKKPKNAISPEVIDDFKNEIRLMLELGKHPNIVSVLGCCTVEEPFYLLTDFMQYGDLLHFLRKCCNEENAKLDPIYQIATINQLQIAQQIADGMNYVSHTRFFHGDLAARNILVGGGLLVKITDFGLTDDLYQKGYTRLQSDARRPYKWYSPESIEHQFCTLKTDIWSFGVLMWEILTFGQQTPYRGMSIQEVLYRLKDGYRMPCPEGTPDFMEKMLHTCWQLDPEERPSFGDLLETINFLLEKGTGDDNYITAEDDEMQPENIMENNGSLRKKKSLVQLLNFEDIDPSEISGSCESAFSGGSKFSSGYSSTPLSTIAEAENQQKETV